jgi:hypothetical protein
MQTNNKNHCCIDFQSILNENLKSSKFRKYYKRANKKTELETHFNNILQTLGIRDMFVEIIDIDAYDYKK